MKSKAETSTQQAVEKPRGRGRPRVDTPRPREISTVRTRRLKEQLEAEGGRELSRVRLCAEANQALIYLAEDDRSERAAIEKALIDQAERRRKKSR
ncbi:hypothetical protein AT395_25190 (plasmid) [Pandoraea apista]|nr:hypothetical protein AT395_24835 [Pandoraea apista]ALS68439.2 hypothetical protein AT395_25190 [Pandoraea apista]